MIPTIVDQALDNCIWWYYCMSHILVMYHLLLPCTMIYPPSLGSY